MIFSRLKMWLAAAGGVVLAVGFAFLRGWSAGKEDAEDEFRRDKAKREGAGRDKVREGRDSGLPPDERVRRNDGDWRGM